MSILHNTAVIPPSTSILHHGQDDSSKVTEQLGPERQSNSQVKAQKLRSDRISHEHEGRSLRQRSQKHKKYGLSGVGVIRPLVRLVRQPVKTIGELYAETDWVFDDGKKLEQVHKRETELLYSHLKQVSMSI